MENNQNGQQPILQIPQVEFQFLVAPPSLDENLLNQIDGFIKGVGWAESHQCVTMIRSINKFNPQFIPNVMGKYGPILKDLFNDGKTQLIKNILKLLKQVFIAANNINVQGTVAQFLPALLKRAGTDKLNHIKQLCQEILTIIAQNCGYNITITTVCQFTHDKLVPVSELSIKLLAALIQKINQNLTQFESNSLQILMKALSMHVEGKRNNMKNNALDICIFICSAIGSQNYLQLMNYSLNQGEVQSMGTAMEFHRTSKQKQKPLADVLKQRKTTQMQSYCNGNNYSSYNGGYGNNQNYGNNNDSMNHMNNFR